LKPNPDCFSGVATTYTKFGSSDQVSVCAVPGICDAHFCAVSCAVDADCPPGPLCQTSTHRCVGCASDDDCFGAGTSHCDIPTGTCQCATDDDCTDPLFGVHGTDKCIDGKCGCSGTSVCTDYPDATIACE
jgi:hypothetical protein